MTGDLRPIGEGLVSFLSELGLGRPAPLTRLVRDWEKLAGSPWAEWARPVVVRDGELVVEVKDGTAASLLRYRVTELTDRIDAALGPEIVRSVVIRVARKGRGSSTDWG